MPDRSFLRLLSAPLLGLVLMLGVAACGGDEDSSGASGGAERETLRIGVGPLLPTAEDTQAAWDPFFAWLAGELGMDYELTATTEWAGISVAMRNDQLDMAWMGPFGYVLAEEEAGARAIATAKYDEKPIYHAIVVAQPGSGIERWPQDAKGKSISFADIGSTSGWLIPTNWFRQRGIDPKTYFEYSEGATHAANEVAVANGQVDLATDFDRNRNAMIDAGTIDEEDTEIVWRSDPLPNDAIALSRDFDPELEARVKEALLSLTPEQAAEILPDRYTGFVEGDSETYAPIREAAQALDVLEE
ncbi:MAG: phosphate/phosphite/phosphonate ABC transporter substrate-binding protein [Solirubrobacteraceae bacterium]